MLGPTTGGAGFGFKVDQVMALTGLTYRQITHWQKEGIVNPSISGPKGSERLFSFLDLVQTKIASELKGRGMNLSAIKFTINGLRKSNLWHSGDFAALVLEGENGVEVLSPSQWKEEQCVSFGIVVPVKKFVEDLRHEMGLAFA